MLSELARVFSSQGVLIQGTQYAPGRGRSNSTIADSEEIGEGQRFAVEFEQASAKLELSKAAKERIAETERLARQDKDVRSHEQAHLASADPSGQDRAVAAAAAAMALEARKALAQEKETTGRKGYGNSPETLGTKINVRA